MDTFFLNRGKQKLDVGTSVFLQLCVEDGSIANCFMYLANWSMHWSNQKPFARFCCASVLNRINEIRNCGEREWQRFTKRPAHSTPGAA